ncbi:MAG: hypothetical protein LBU90_07515 [Bacteroidales bacterium]|jgi:hypothetical protein|nr:hypothetical protein [Bacteroidales bacterium]
MAKKTIFNPFLKGNFDNVNDYDAEIAAILKYLKKVEEQYANNDEKISEIETIREIVKSIQGNLIITANPAGSQSGANPAFFNISYEQYNVLNGSQKFFVTLDNPYCIDNQGNTISAPNQYAKVYLRIQYNKVQYEYPAVPHNDCTYSDSNPFSGFVGWHKITENTSIALYSTYDTFYAKFNGGYASPEDYDKKYTYKIDSNGAAWLWDDAKNYTIQEANDVDLLVGKPQFSPEPDVKIESRDALKLDFGTLSGQVWHLSGKVTFTHSYCYQKEGTADQYIDVQALHSRTQEAQFMDCVDKRSLMRVNIDMENKLNSLAFLIGSQKLTAPAPQYNADTKNLGHITYDVELTHAEYPADESVIYIHSAENMAHADECARIVYNENPNPAFITDRSFSIYLDTNAPKNIQLWHNGVQQPEDLVPGGVVYLFWSYTDKVWSVKLQEKADSNLSIIHVDDTWARYYNDWKKTEYTSKLVDVVDLAKGAEYLRNLISLDKTIFLCTNTDLADTIGEEVKIPIAQLHNPNGTPYEPDLPTVMRPRIIFDAQGRIAVNTPRKGTSQHVFCTTVYAQQTGDTSQLEEELRQLIEIEKQTRTIAINSLNDWKLNAYADIFVCDKNNIDTLVGWCESPSRVVLEKRRMPFFPMITTGTYDANALNGMDDVGVYHLPSSNIINTPSGGAGTPYLVVFPFLRGVSGDCTRQFYISWWCMQSRYIKTNGEWSEWEDVEGNKQSITATPIESFPFALCEGAQNFNPGFVGVMVIPAVNTTVKQAQICVQTNHTGGNFCVAIYDWNMTFVRKTLIGYLSRSEPCAITADFEDEVLLYAGQRYYAVLFIDHTSARYLAAKRIKSEIPNSMNVLQTVIAGSEIVPPIVNGGYVNLQSYIAQSFPGQYNQVDVPFIRIF